MQESNNNLDKRLRASTIVSSLVLIALVVYGIRSKRKIGFYLLSIFILAPTAGWITAAVSGPLLDSTDPTKEEPTK